jgi:hypothetical protein
MIVGAEVGLLMVGLYALILGRFPVSKKSKNVIEGPPARAIGLIGLVPIPLSIFVTTVVATLMGARGRGVTPQSFFWVGTAIEGSIVLVCVVTMSVLGRIYGTPAGPPARDEPA